ncbi:MAG TPA: hypothetical protein VLA60_04315 [Nitrospirales bacterium]|nr:hypothetical protein [Nitrospirales bacterium]
MLKNVQAMGMSFTFITVIVLALGWPTAQAMTAAEIDVDVQKVLTDLYAQSDTAKDFGAVAKGILVFPDVYKAGFLVGANFGDGALLKNGRTAGYYRSLELHTDCRPASNPSAMCCFFMQDSVLEYLDKSAGWEIGVGPSLVVVDKGFAGSMTTTTAKDDIYAFFFDQKGLMAGLGLKGSKITRIHPD